MLSETHEWELLHYCADILDSRWSNRLSSYLKHKCNKTKLQFTFLNEACASEYPSVPLCQWGRDMSSWEINKGGKVATLWQRLGYMCFPHLAGSLWSSHRAGAYRLETFLVAVSFHCLFSTFATPTINNITASMRRHVKVRRGGPQFCPYEPRKVMLPSALLMGLCQ